jgi:hypothetical protein
MRTAHPSRQHGVATVELGFMIIWMWFLGVAMFALLHYLYQFVVTRHATQAAATYMATTPHYQLYNGTEILAARAVVQRIVSDNIAGAGIATPEILDVSFYCGAINDLCRELDASPGVPLHIRAEYTFSDPLWTAEGFGGGNMGGDNMWRVDANSSAVFLK